MSQAASLELLDKLAQLARVSLPNTDRVVTAIEVLELQPGECAFREGDRQQHLYVVRRGLLKQYYTSADGAEWIKSFTAEGDVFACIEAMSGELTSFSSEAIESAVVERVSYDVIERLAREHVEWQTAFATAYACFARLKVKRERDLLMLSAEDLYRAFVAEKSHLSERIPQKDLAGYIGVTAVGLNRIVKRCRMSPSCKTSEHLV